jgi:hypothetical protein
MSYRTPEPFHHLPDLSFTTGYLILGQNEFTGTIPNDMSLTSLFHLDLSDNQLTGTLPADIGENFRPLRQLYLNHNQFTGTIPETYAQAGGGRLYVLALNHNQVCSSKRCLPFRPLLFFLITSALPLP